MLWDGYRTGNFNYRQEWPCWTSHPYCIASVCCMQHCNDSKKCILLHQLHILKAPSSALSSVNTVFMPKKKKKNGVPSNPETLVTSLLSHLALLTTKCYFFGEYDLWRSKEKCFTSEQMSLLRCHSSVFQYGWDGSVLDVPEEKVLCPEKPVRVSAVCCWRKKALGLEKVSCLSPQSKARPGLCECSTCSPR